jgi:transcriptional regulator with XRE-family HTH domain
MTVKSDKLSDQLRQAIDASGMSRYAIAKAIGLDQSVLSRFMAGKSGLAVETIDNIGELLGLRIVTEKKPSKSKGR